MHDCAYCRFCDSMIHQSSTNTNWTVSYYSLALLHSSGYIAKNCGPVRLCLWWLALADYALAMTVKDNYKTDKYYIMFPEFRLTYDFDLFCQINGQMHPNVMLIWKPAYYAEIKERKK